MESIDHSSISSKLPERNEALAVLLRHEFIVN